MLTIKMVDMGAAMTTPLYRCPRNGLLVQGSFADDASSGAESYLSLTCLSCGGNHFVKSEKRQGAGPWTHSNMQRQRLRAHLLDYLSAPQPIRSAGWPLPILRTTLVQGGAQFV